MSKMTNEVESKGKQVFSPRKIEFGREWTEWILGQSCVTLDSSDTRIEEISTGKLSLLFALVATEKAI